jgi:hypothetical protein
MTSRALRLTALVMLLLFGSASRAVPLAVVTDLSGSAEAPPNASPGTGAAEVDFDLLAHTLHVQLTFVDLLGTTSASHIHCCVAPPGTAGVATATPTFPGFPLGVTAGSYDRTFDTLDLATYNPAFVSAHGGTAAGAEAALFAGIDEGNAYLNVHTDLFPGGEIRGFLAAAPEPGSLALLMLALAAAGGCARRRWAGTGRVDAIDTPGCRAAPA